MSTVSVEIDSMWVKRARSPIFRLVAAFQGVAITSAPLFLYGTGKGVFHNKYDYLVAASCFATIYLVGWFYVCLGGEVIGELRNESRRVVGPLISRCLAVRRRHLPITPHIVPKTIEN